MNGRHFLAVIVAVALVPGAVRAESAYDQLLDACRKSGGNCNPNIPMPSAPEPVDPPRGADSRGGGETRDASRPQPRPKPKPRLTQSQQLGLMVAEGLLQSFISGMFETPAGPDPAELERIRREQILELQRRAETIRGQRGSREAENDANLDAMAAALSSPWDTAAPAPTGPVQLNGTQVALFAPPELPARSPTPPPSAATERLVQLARENEDVAALTGELADLEGQLAAAREDALTMRRRSDRRVEEYQEMEASVARGVESAKERGMGMAFDGLFLMNGKALATLGEVQASGRPWKRMLGLLEETHTGFSGAKDAVQTAGQLLDDAGWALRKRELGQDFTYLAKRLGGPYAELGESILTSAITVREQLEVLRRQRELSGVHAAYRAELERVAGELQDLTGRIKTVKARISDRTSIPADQVRLPPPPRAPGLGSAVPLPVE